MSHDTEFAGLTELDPGDPITVEGAAFTEKNPSRTDLYLKIGAVTHKHDAHPKLGDPTQTVSAAVAIPWATGQIAADTQLFIAYTLTDKYGGESRRGPAATLTTAAGFSAPSAAISASFIASAGSLPVGQFAYALTLNDATGGESTLGPAVFIQRPPGFINGEILLTALSQELARSGIGWTSWNLWRAQDGGSFQVVATNQTSDSFIDDGLICTDAARVPPNTMRNVAANNALFFTLPVLGSEPGLASANTVNVYISLDGSFTDQCYYGSFPALASAGEQVEADALTLHAGSPPNVSLTSQGASQIDPDTDILDWNWKRPVHTPAELPTTGNASGDARACLTPAAIFVWDGIEWEVVAAASGVGGAGVGGGGASGIYYDSVAGDGKKGQIGWLAITAPGFFGAHPGAPIIVDTIISSGSALVGLSIPEQLASSNTGGSATMFRAIEFVGSGGTTVVVKQNPYPWGFVDPGAGSAVVIISSPSGAAGASGAVGATGPPGPAGSAANFVASAGTASAIVGPYLGFAGSAGVSVQLVQQGGSAVVLIGASAIQGPQGIQGLQGPAGTGGGVGGVYLAGSAGANPAPFGAETYLEFVGSGGTGVAVQNLTGGSARVLISASGTAGGQGPAGAPGPAGSAVVLGPTLRFSDDFATNDVGNWTITSGSPTITGGLFTSDGGDDRAQVASAAGGLYSQQRVQAKFPAGSDVAVMVKFGGGGALWAQYSGGTFAIKDFITGTGQVAAVSYTPPSPFWIRLTFTVSTPVSGLAVAEIFTSDPNAPGAIAAQTLAWTTATSSVINSAGTVGWRVNGAGSVDDFYYWSMNTPQPNAITAHVSGQDALGGYTDLAFSASAAAQPPQVAVNSLGGGSALVVVGVSPMASAWSDDFSANDHTYGASGTTLSISGGTLNPSDTTLKTPYASGLVLAEFVSTVKVTPGASVGANGQDISLTGRFVDSSNYIFAQAFAANNSNNIQIFLKSNLAGSISTYNSKTLTGLKWQQGVPYWLRFIHKALYMRLELWTQDPNTAPVGARPFGLVEGIMLNGDVSTLVAGPAGLRWTPDSSSATLDDFKIHQILP